MEAPVGNTFLESSPGHCCDDVDVCFIDPDNDQKFNDLAIECFSTCGALEYVDGDGLC